MLGNFLTKRCNQFGFTYLVIFLEFLISFDNLSFKIRVKPWVNNENAGQAGELSER